MKQKLLTIKSLLVAVLLGVGVNGAWADVIYSWEGGSSGATQTGGTIAGTVSGASNNESVNYANSTYYTLRLNGATDYSDHYITITLDNALAAGDVIRVTGYRNKNDVKSAGLKAKFNVGSSTIAQSTGFEFVNIDTSDGSSSDTNRGTEPNTCTFTIPADAATSTTIQLTRSHTQTALFITKFEVIRPTVNADIDFSNAITGTTPYTVSGTVGAMTWTNQWTVTPYINNDGVFCFGNFTGVVNLVNNNIRSKDNVVISFEMGFGKLSGKYVGIRLKDTDGNVQLEQQFDAYNSDFDDKNPLGLDFDNMYHAQNNPYANSTYPRRTYFTISIDYVTRKIKTHTVSYKSGTDKAATIADYETEWTSQNAIGKFELYGNISNSDRYHTFDNLKITTIEGDYNSSKTITYAYQDNNGADISALILANGGLAEATPDAGSLYTPEYPASVTDDEYAYDYTYASGGDAFTVTTDATITLIYNKTAHPTTDVTVQYKNGSTVLKSEVIANAYPVGKPIGYALRKYVLDDTNDILYQTASAMGTWRNPAAAATIDESVEATSIEDVVFFAEGEEIATKSGTGNSTIASRQSMGRFSSDSKICELGAGKYRFFAEIHCGNGSNTASVNGTLSVKAGETTIGTKAIMEKTNNQTLQFDFIIAENKDILIQYGGGNASGVDYVYIQRLGDAAITTSDIPTSTYATISSAYALDFANATDGSSQKTLKAYTVSALSATSATLTEVTEAPANTGIILMGTAGQTYTIPVLASASDVGTNKLHAAVTATPLADGSFYVLKGGKFLLVTGAADEAARTVPAGKAYLLASEVTAPSLTLDFGDVTGINTLNVEHGLLNGQFFDLQGRKVAKPAKGLYIVNGKKVVIK